MGKFHCRMATKDGNCRVDVRRSISKPRKVLLDRWIGRPVRDLSVAGNQLRLATQEGCNDLSDGYSITFRVAGYALQGVESTDPRIKFIGPKLIDRASESFSYVPFAIHLHLSPSCYRPNDNQQASYCLQKHRASTILQLTLGLLELYADVYFRDGLQLIVS